MKALTITPAGQIDVVELSGDENTRWRETLLAIDDGAELLERVPVGRLTFYVDEEGTFKANPQPNPVATLLATALLAALLAALGRDLVGPIVGTAVVLGRSELGYKDEDVPDAILAMLPQLRRLVDEG